MSEISAARPSIVNLMDDILAYGATKAKHDKRLQQMLETLARAGITLNKSKCCFGVTEISFLGFLVSKDGIKPNPDKVITIENLETPRTVADVHRFLGMANHLARLLPHLSKMSVSSQQLLQEGCEWTWGPAQEDALDSIKEIICSNHCTTKYYQRYLTILSTCHCRLVGEVE